MASLIGRYFQLSFLRLFVLVYSASMYLFSLTVHVLFLAKLGELKRFQPNFIASVPSAMLLLSRAFCFPIMQCSKAPLAGAGLVDIASRQSCIIDVRGRGLMVGVELGAVPGQNEPPAGIASVSVNFQGFQDFCLVRKREL